MHWYLVRDFFAMELILKHLFVFSGIQLQRHHSWRQLFSLPQSSSLLLKDAKRCLPVIFTYKRLHHALAPSKPYDRAVLLHSSLDFNLHSFFLFKIQLVMIIWVIQRMPVAVISFHCMQLIAHGQNILGNIYKLFGL